jgi:transcriptional regulator with XRE-family HTH domain
MATPAGDGYDGKSWGDYIRRLKDRPGLSIAELARRTGYNPSTFFDWMSPNSRKRVTIPSILAVAHAAGDNPVDAFKAAAGLTSDEPEDVEIAMVRDSGLAEVIQDEIIANIRDWRERSQEIERQRGLLNTRQMIQIAGGRVA